MTTENNKNSSLKYLTPSNLYAQLAHFTSGMAVTKGIYELVVPKCKLEDIEWNHMDQMHRLSIHNTYEKAIRIATGKDFAVSLTQWKKWPFFITVTDIYISKGLFYQTLTLAGVIFVHSIISMKEVDDGIHLTDEWYIASHKLFRFLHKPLNKKLFVLNERLQKEDEPLRQGRFELRKSGYTFRTDEPNYYNSNLLGLNTIYPKLSENAFISLEDITEIPTTHKVDKTEFIIKKSNNQTYLIWPSVCPHEGGPLMQGTFCQKNKITCPWHGLHFKAAELSVLSPYASGYGFEYQLIEKRVYVTLKDTTCENSDIQADNCIEVG